MKEIAFFCNGVIFCAWFAGATSEQVALIRLPAALFLCLYVGLLVVDFARRRWGR